MSWTNNGRAIDLTAQDYAGWCLRHQQRTFPGSPAAYYNSARQAWDNAIQHPELPDGSAIVPIYFSWIGDLGDGQGRIDWGHAATWVPGSGVFSSPGSGYGNKWFGSIAECAAYFGATYLGWTEDVGGYRVVDYVADPTPAPAPTPPPAPSGTYYTVVPDDNLWNIAVTYYGDGTRYPEIAAANSIPDPNLIFPGQVLLIPGV